MLIDRLNEIAGADSKALGDLIEARVPCNEALADHPSVQVFAHEGPPTVGLLGILNGLVGTIDEGPRKGWGFIAAVFEDDGTFSHFRRTDAPKLPPVNRQP
jgi:hypothetical protein